MEEVRVFDKDVRTGSESDSRPLRERPSPYFFLGRISALSVSLSLPDLPLLRLQTGDDGGVCMEVGG